MPERGLFIVLEGLDRSGKSTQVDRLLDRLNRDGRRAVLQKFPGALAASHHVGSSLTPDRTTAIGKMIDAYLQSKSELDDRAIHLLFSANRWELANKIESQLAQGIDVIADRYAFSGIAFSAGKGLDFDFCLNPDRGLPLPDVVLYLTVPPEVASSRAAFGAERYETVELQNKVRHKFAKVAAVVTQRHGEIWREIEAVGSIEEVESKVWTEVSACIERGGRRGELWVEK